MDFSISSLPPKNDLLAAVAGFEQHVVDAVHAAGDGHEFDIERRYAFGQREVGLGQTPLARIVGHVEVVFERLRPSLAVLRDAHLEVGFEEGVGRALRIPLRAERELQVAVRHGDLFDREMVGCGAEEDVVLARTVVERKVALRGLVGAYRHALKVVGHVVCARTLVVDPSVELVEVGPRRTGSVGLRSQFLVERAVIDGPFGNHLLVFAQVFDFCRDGVHVALVGAEEPAGDLDLVVVVFLFEVFAHVVEASLDRGPLDFDVGVVARHEHHARIGHVFHLGSIHVGFDFGCREGGGFGSGRVVVVARLVERAALAELQQAVAAFGFARHGHDVAVLQPVSRALERVHAGVALLEQHALLVVADDRGLFHREGRSGFGGEHLFERGVGAVTVKRSSVSWMSSMLRGESCNVVL